MSKELQEKADQIVRELKEALQALTPREPTEQLLERTRSYVDATLAYLGEPPTPRD